VLLSAKVRKKWEKTKGLWNSVRKTAKPEKVGGGGRGQEGGVHQKARPGSPNLKEGALGKVKKKRNKKKRLCSSAYQGERRLGSGGGTRKKPENHDRKGEVKKKQCGPSGAEKGEKGAGEG